MYTLHMLKYNIQTYSMIFWNFLQYQSLLKQQVMYLSG